MNNNKKIDRKRTFRNNLYMLKLIINACPGVLILTAITSVLGAINSFLLNTYIYKYTLNALHEGVEVKTILMMLCYIFVYSYIYVLVQNVANCYFELKHPIVEAYIQDLLHKKSAEVDISCFESSQFYDTYVKATGEATNRAYTVMNNIFETVWCVVYVIAVGSVIITIDYLFLILAILPLLCTLLVGKKRNRIRYDYNMRNRELERQRDYVRRTFYLKDFSKEMRLTEMWKVMFKRMHSCVDEMKEIVNKYGYKIMFFRYLFDLVLGVIVESGTIIIAAYKTLVTKNMLIGDCFMVIYSISNIAGNINHVIDLLFKFDENSLYIDNLRDFLDYKVRITENRSAPVVSSFKSLELKNIAFRYEGQANNALSNVNIIIKAGEKIAIVGHNGAGKTTLVKLLLRLYDPNEGQILLNGIDIKNYRLSSYRNLFGTVFQDYHLFAMTIAENVMLHGNISDDEKTRLNEALEKVGISEKIKSLSKGIDSSVTKEFDNDGVIFSGGESQKVVMARIFAGGQDIIIMDEPSSALDPIAEDEMYRNMLEVCEGKTVIFISHRLSSATMADRVYVFENGQIIEEGTHRELIAANGKYTDMWRKQACNYADEKV